MKTSNRGLSVRHLSGGELDQAITDAQMADETIVVWGSYGYREQFTVSFTANPQSWSSMPPDGYTTVTISDSLATKLARIMVCHDRPSFAEAIKYTANATLVQKGEITVQELIQLLAGRVNEVDETSLR